MTAFSGSGASYDLDDIDTSDAATSVEDMAGDSYIAQVTQMNVIDGQYNKQLDVCAFPLDHQIGGATGLYHEYLNFKSKSRNSTWGVFLAALGALDVKLASIKDLHGMIFEWERDTIKWNIRGEEHEREIRRPVKVFANLEAAKQAIIAEGGTFYPPLATTGQAVATANAPAAPVAPASRAAPPAANSEAAANTGSLGITISDAVKQIIVDVFTKEGPLPHAGVIAALATPLNVAGHSEEFKALVDNDRLMRAAVVAGIVVVTDDGRYALPS